MITVDKIDDSFAFAGDGLYVHFLTGEPRYLNAFIVVGIQIEHLVTYGTTEPGFFHLSASQETFRTSRSPPPEAYPAPNMYAKARRWPPKYRGRPGLRESAGRCCRTDWRWKRRAGTPTGPAIR